MKRLTRVYTDMNKNRGKEMNVAEYSWNESELQSSVNKLHLHSKRDETDNTEMN